MEQLSVSVPAKINLHLQILGRRRDGFHELRTLMQSVSVRDTLTAEMDPEGELILEVHPEKSRVPSGKSNLVLMAALALRRETGCKLGAKLKLFKEIPVGAGMGGGSADAAAALVLLDRLWELNLDARALQGMAAQLGSDVSFFLYGGLVLAVGRGEEAYPLADLSPMGVLLVKPPESVSTAKVYANVGDRLRSPKPDESVTGFWLEEGAQVRWGELGNDLQSASIGQCAEVGTIVDRLGRLDSVLSGVTGSGSAVFALFPDVAEAERAVDGLETDPSWWVRVCETLTREQARL